ncbi:MAG: hypothetical protein IS860_02765 [Nitrosopumilus sp.]|nr:hypothetical protein [Nitrosopumilus sp.]MCE2506978.1 hypothetical protein [Nitrosopumilaceae archaeon]
MTRKRPGFLGKLRNSLRTVDQSFTNRDDLHNQNKIQKLEERMSDKVFGDALDNLDIPFQKFSNKKMSIKNSKRY